MSNLDNNEYFYIAIMYDHVCIAGKYKTRQDAERDLVFFPKDSQIFSSENSNVGSDDVVNKARELIYQAKTSAESQP